MEGRFWGRPGKRQRVPCQNTSAPWRGTRLVLTGLQQEWSCWGELRLLRGSGRALAIHPQPHTPAPLAARPYES